jgi:hypothetical protein
VLEASQRTLGNEHPDTLLAMNNLAITIIFRRSYVMLPGSGSGREAESERTSIEELRVFFGSGV